MRAEPEPPGLSEHCTLTPGFAGFVAARKHSAQAGDPGRDTVPSLASCWPNAVPALRGSGGGGADEGLGSLGHRQGEQGADGL